MLPAENRTTVAFGSVPHGYISQLYSSINFIFPCTVAFHFSIIFRVDKACLIDSRMRSFLFTAVDSYKIVNSGWTDK